MDVGQVIAGKRGKQYRIMKPLGRPGLFGQAFLCQQVDPQAEYVVKALRGDATPETRNRMFDEARTLERVAQVERKHDAYYAVRLIDESQADAAEPFIILERATGENVLDDLIEGVSDWYKAPLPESLVLDIAWHFARALSYVHQAGLAYNDMKLDNLFWRKDHPQDPLRIIDWNVTTELKAAPQELVNDWARFGARLHHLYTGISIGLDRNGLIVGKRPAGMLWERIPYGIRALIEKALSKGYTNDDLLLADLQRERAQATNDAATLLSQARVADGQQTEATAILAPLWRAEQLLATDPTSQTDELLKEINELRQRGLARQGRVSNENLQQLEQLLLKGERSLAKEQAERLHRRVQEADPHVRRWLWVTQFATTNPDLFAQLRTQLIEALGRFHAQDYTTARSLLSNMLGRGEDVLGNLYYEAQAYEAEQAQAYQEALGRLRQVTTLESTKDLQDFQKTLEERQRNKEQQEQERGAAVTIYNEVVASSEKAQEQYERAQDATAYATALDETKKAINGLASLHRDYAAYLPEIRQDNAPLPARDDLIRDRERLDAIIALNDARTELLQQRAVDTMNSPVFAERIRYIKQIQPSIAAFDQKRKAVSDIGSEDEWKRIQRALQLDSAEKFVELAGNLADWFRQITAYHAQTEAERALRNKEDLTDVQHALDSTKQEGITQLEGNDASVLVAIQSQVAHRLAQLDPISRQEYRDAVASIEEENRQLREQVEVLRKELDEAKQLAEQLRKDIRSLTTQEQLEQVQQTFNQGFEQHTTVLAQEIEASERERKKTDLANEFLITLNTGNYSDALAVIETTVKDTTNPQQMELARKLLRGIGLHRLKQINALSYTDFANQPTTHLPTLNIERCNKLVQQVEPTELHPLPIAIKLYDALSRPALQDRTKQTQVVLQPLSLDADISKRLENIRAIAAFFSDQYKQYSSKASPDADLKDMEEYIAFLARHNIAVEHVQRLPYAQTLYDRATELYKSELATSKKASDPRRREEAEERCERCKRIREDLPAKKRMTS
ncbi:hypothetical protein HC928_01720 [bacterium]|nr:hypothetical protein [bacterium]